VKITQHVKTAAMTVVCIWLVFLADWVLPVDFRGLGIRPREIGGLLGIPLAPVLHGSLAHLLANSGALFVLLLLTLAFSPRLAATAIGTIVLMGGGLVWLFGSGRTVHIGASGLIFGLIGFLVCMGLFRKEWTALVVSVLVLGLYGGALLSLLVATPGISWSGHFYGFLCGVLTAWWLRNSSR
jgi:membrane associated rhomboid family serine protease